MKEIVNLYDWRGVKLGSYRCIILFEAVRHYQCDQITKFCVIFRKLQQWTFVQKYNIFARVGLKACQMLNKAFLNGLRLIFLPIWSHWLLTTWFLPPINQRLCFED